MQKRHWVSLDQGSTPTVVEKLYQHRLLPEILNLPMSEYLTATCPFSGPIALLHSPSKSKSFHSLPKGHENSIAIYSCKGELKKIIKFKIEERILYFGFTYLEELLVIYANADWCLIRPYRGEVEKGTYGAGERVLGVEVVKNEVYMLREKGFFKVPSINNA